MKKETIVECVCLKCGKKWYPKAPGRPKTCANKLCRSPYWDVPRKVKSTKG
jgi:hypothetical protein